MKLIERFFCIFFGHDEDVTFHTVNKGHYDEEKWYIHTCVHCGHKRS